MKRPAPLIPGRVRRIEPPFAWIPFRLLRDGWLEQLDAAAQLLYFFLCLVSDRRGVSFYGERRLEELLHLSPPVLARARAELCRRDLVAFDGRVYQVLSLPAPAVVAVAAPGATLRAIDLRSRRVRGGGPRLLGEVLREMLEPGPGPTRQE